MPLGKIHEPPKCGLLLLFLLQCTMLLPAVAVACEDFCTAPCDSLNGNIHDECGGCPDEPQYTCRPGAPGFLELTAETLLRPKQMEVAVEDGVATRERPAEFFLAQPTPLTATSWPATDVPSAEERGSFLVGTVGGEFARVQVLCRTEAHVTSEQSAHGSEGGAGEIVVQRLEDGSSWSLSDPATPLSDALRTHAATACANPAGTTVGVAYGGQGTDWGAPARGYGSSAWDTCGSSKHMYDNAKWQGTTRVAADAECRRARHLRAFGEWGFPDDEAPSPSRPTPSPSVTSAADVNDDAVLAARGHLQPFGYQGQPRRSVREHAGCADAPLAEGILRNTPLVMRGCVTERSPRALEWTAEYLTKVAANQSSRFCPDHLGDYLAAGMPYYRNCGQLPRVLLEDVALPEALRGVRDRLDSAVLWTGNVSYFGKSSPLHFDPNENIMHLLDGEKHLLLIDPVESVLLYADFAAASFGNSPVDPRRVDMRKYPLVSKAGIWPVRLRRGDALLIPSGWWHIVTTQRGRSVALTLQFNNLLKKNYELSAVFSLMLAQEKLALRHSPPAPPTPMTGLPSPSLTLADATFNGESEGSTS